MHCFGAGRVAGGLGSEVESDGSSGVVRGFGLEAETHRNLLPTLFLFHKFCLC